VTAAADALVTPVPTALIPDFVDFGLNFPDLVSPSYWVSVALDHVVGVNPVAWATEHFAGDWEKVARAASALEHLATFHARYADELDAARDALSVGWDGEAAAGALRYFSELEAAVTAQVPLFEEIGHCVDQVAQGIKATHSALVSLVRLFLDELIGIAITAAATAVSGWTGVGAIIGGSATAAQIAGAIQTWLRVIDLHGKAMLAMYGFFGAAAGYLGAVHGFTTHPLPAGAYDNPAM